MTGVHPRPTFDQRLLTQAVRNVEEREGFSAAAAPLENQLATAEDSLETRIVYRAGQLDLAPGLKAALEQLRKRVRWLVIIALVVMLLAGALAVSQAFVRSPDGTVNFFWLLLSLLGINLLALLLWSLVMVLRPATAQGSSLAALVFAGLRRFLPHGAEPHALAAWFRVYTTEPLLRWFLGSLVQGIWLAYLSGGVLMVLLQLLSRQFDFVWETTLLGDQAFIGLTSWLASVPAIFGFDSLSPEQVAGSRLGTNPEMLASVRSQWAALLLASLVCYGLLPRLLLLLLCGWRLRRAEARYRLDLFEPYFITLQQRLHPLSRQLGVVDADDAPPGSADVMVNTPAFMPPSGEKIAWLGLDLPEEQRGWPPANYPEPRQVGVASDRASREIALQRVRELDAGPLVVEVLLSCSPDRGIGRYLQRLLEKRDPSQTWLALSGREQLAGQLTGPDVEQRIWDWHRLAGEAGIAADHIIHLEPPSRGETGLL